MGWTDHAPARSFGSWLHDIKRTEKNCDYNRRLDPPNICPESFLDVTDSIKNLLLSEVKQALVAGMSALGVKADPAQFGV